MMGHLLRSEALQRRKSAWHLTLGKPWLSAAVSASVPKTMVLYMVMEYLEGATQAELDALALSLAKSLKICYTTNDTIATH